MKPQVAYPKSNPARKPQLPAEREAISE